MLSGEEEVLLARAYHNKGLSLYRLERYEESLKYYEKAIELGYRKSILNKGISLSELNREHEAIICFDMLIQELEGERLEEIFDMKIDQLEEEVQLALDVEQMLKEVKATQKLEGLEVSKETEELIRECLLEKITFDEAREKIFQQIKLENVITDIEQLMLEVEEEEENR